MLLGSALVYEVTIDEGAVLKRGHWQPFARAPQIRVSLEIYFSPTLHTSILFNFGLRLFQPQLNCLLS